MTENHTQGNLSELQVLAAADYLTYCKYVHNGRWIPAKFHRLIANVINEAMWAKRDGRIENNRIMFFLPPQHGKSQEVTETLPSYFLGWFPEQQVIEVSYGDSLAQRFGKYNRQKVVEYGKELFNIELSKEKSSVTDWNINGHRGGMLSVGIGAGITGNGADLLIIDDPIKNREEAESETYRNKVWDEWQSTILTRTHPDAIIIIILTRWHEDDLAGRLLNPEYGTVENWRIISLPCIADSSDIIMRNIGEPLWPEHGYDKQWAIQRKAAVGSRVWESLYQQKPTPAEGTMIKREWWKYYKEAPSIEQFEEILESWDMTFKNKDDNDYVVGQVWGRIKASKYLLDQVRDRMTFTGTLKAVKNLTEKWNKKIEGTGLYLYKLVEDKANGTAVIDTLNREVGGFIPIEPEGSKEARMAAVSPSIEAGNVYIPDPSIASWINDYVEELAAFPNGAHDDQADPTSQALARLNKVIPSEETETELDKLKKKFGEHSLEYQVHSRYVQDDSNDASMEDLGL